MPMGAEEDLEMTSKVRREFVFLSVTGNCDDVKWRNGKRKHEPQALIICHRLRIFLRA